MNCRICNNDQGNTTYEVREMMFGTKDVFKYSYCGKCNCLQIEDYPESIGVYYTDDYYSLEKSNNKFQIYLSSLRDNYAFNGKSLLGKYFYSKFPNPELLSLRSLGLEKEMRLLDVGCGAGKVLWYLREQGFKNLLGLEPFIDKDIIYNNGLRILKKGIQDIDNEWDVIMFHHSLEHIPNQLSTLQKVKELLSPEGICIIRIPLVSSFAWENYGVNWVQLDAPRHFYLHSRKSMELLARQAGLKVEKVEYDSSPFQFWGSEQYLNNIPLMDKRSRVNGLRNSMFSKSEMSQFIKRSEELNKNQRGDQAVFIMKRKQP